MRVAVLSTPGELVLEDRPEPQPGPGEVGRVDLDRLVTGTYGLAQAVDALTAGRSAPTAVVRPWE